MSKKKIFIILGIVIVVAVLVYVNLSMNTTKSTDVHAEETKARKLVELVSASGRIQPQTKVDITSEVNGEIVQLLAKEGDFVNQGDYLIILDTVQLRTAVDQARFAMSEMQARLEGAEAVMNQNKEEFERQQRLYKDNLTSETSFTNAKYSFLNSQSSYNATLAQSRQADSRYEQAVDNFKKAKIAAPMSGIITYLDCEVGEIAQAQTAFTQGRTLMTISNLEVFEVEVEVDETEINKVKLLQEVDIEVDAFTDTVFSGEVVEIGNTALISGTGTQDLSTNFKVKVIFKDRNVQIKPGMSATVDIITHKIDNALSIPYSSVVMRSFDMDSLMLARENEGKPGSSEMVTSAQAAENEDEGMDEDSEDITENEEIKGTFVVRDGKARFVQIETGIADQKNIQVTSGLEIGDKVISGPYKVLRTIKDGEAVEIIKKKKKKE